MRLLDDVKLDFDDVLIVPARSTIESRKDVVLEREFLFYHSPRKWIGIPIICSNMVPLTSEAMCKEFAANKMVVALHKYLEVYEIYRRIKTFGSDYVWMSVGKQDCEIDKIQDVANLLGYAPNIVIDVPNGQIQSFVHYCANIRELFPHAIIMAGNVVTQDAAVDLVLYGGVDCPKIQIGPGAQCRTRVVTGVGYGTLSCSIECSSAVHGLKSKERHLGLVCSDGGCKTSGDICKAFGSGSDFCMIGTMLSGTSECEGDWTYKRKVRWIGVPSITSEEEKDELIFYGMSSHLAQEKHGNGKKTYRASEGTVTKVKHKGPVKDTIQEILGGLRSSLSYSGAKSLKEFSKCVTFCRVNK